MGHRASSQNLDSHGSLGKRSYVANLLFSSYFRAPRSEVKLVFRPRQMLCQKRIRLPTVGLVVLIRAMEGFSDV